VKTRDSSQEGARGGTTGSPTANGSGAGQLVAEGIRVHYEGVRAVDGVDLILERGRIMGLIGPNGAGKTTFMNAVSGFVSLTGGRVVLDGVDVTGWAPHRLVGGGLVRTFQDVATFPALTVFENVELGALGAGLSRRAARQRAWELVDSLDLRARASLPASALPHGDERRVGIARAVAAGPKFLLLDEPAAGLDDAETLELTEAIARLRDELDCGVLLVEHDMRIIFRICERIQVLDHGKSIAVGAPEEIRTNKGVVAAYLGAKGAEIAQAQ
jgi:ABC-type branched-subunit amino acid transport system ATPase component